jgi:type I restriction enzyme, S subunit
MGDRSPASWPVVSFGDVVAQVKDKIEARDSGLQRYVAGEHMASGDLRIRRWGEIGSDYLGPAFHMRFRPGDVLYGSRRTYLRKVAVAEFDGITANTTFVLRPADAKRLLPAFLPCVMQTEAFHTHSERESKGSVNRLFGSQRGSTVASRSQFGRPA